MKSPYEKVYMVLTSDGEIRSNWDTGAKIYTRKSSAQRLAKKHSGYGAKFKVYSFELVNPELVEE